MSCLLSEKKHNLGEPIILCYGQSTMRKIIQNGKGKFQDETASRFPQEHWPSVDIDIGDVNGDGFVDIIVANTGTKGAQNRLLINDGKGFFSLAPVCSP